MALLALTVALLAMTVTTTADEVWPETMAKRRSQRSPVSSLSSSAKATTYPRYTMHGNVNDYDDEMYDSEYNEESFTFPEEEELLIPLFEMFNDTDIIQKAKKVDIHRKSMGTDSKNNTELVTGGSDPRVPGCLGGLLLATTALAVATGIL